MKKSLPLLLALASLSTASCTIINVDSDGNLPGLRVDGLVNGHAAFGMSDEEGLLEASILDGPSPGGIAHIRISNLLGVELGLLGAAVNIGPIHLGLGTLFYAPDAPYIECSEEESSGSSSD